jgi:hypothetical protein
MPRTDAKIARPTRNNIIDATGGEVDVERLGGFTPFRDVAGLHFWRGRIAVGGLQWEAVGGRFGPKIGCGLTPR